MLKNLIYITTFACLAASCSTFKPAASTPATQSPTTNAGGVQFISNISIRPDSRQDKSRSTITTINTNAKATTTYNESSADAKAIENYPALNFKYAILEN